MIIMKVLVLDWDSDIFDKVEIFLEQREVAFLSPRKICENLNFSTLSTL